MSLKSNPTPFSRDPKGSVFPRTALSAIILTTLLLTPITLAQPATQPSSTRPAFAGAGRGQFLIERFRQATSDLDLTPDQKSKIDSLLNETQDEMPDLQSLPQSERQEKLRSVTMDLREKILAVLTDDQAAKFRDKLQNQRQPGGGGNGGGGNGRGGNARGGNAGGGNSGRFNAGPGRPGGPGNDNNNPPQDIGGGPIRIQATLERLNESLATLDLSPDQKTKVRAIVDDNTKQLVDLRDQMFSGAVQPQEAREEFPKIFAGMRDQLADVLTQDQQLKLRDAIQTRYDRDTKPAAPATAPAASMMKGDPDSTMKTDPFSNEKPSAPTESKPAAAAMAQANSGDDLKPAVGDAAPDFDVQTLSGRNLNLASFKGKPLVIEFGSYSSPSFRQRAAKFEELSRQYGNRAGFVIVYTREAHPTGGWEVDRNRDEGVRVAQATDLTARQSQAKQARQLLKITTPMAVDSMDNKTANDYSAGEDTTIIIGRDGKIFARETWMDPYRLKASLDEAITVKPTTMPVDG